MRDVTNLMNIYREASPNLWNAYFSRLEMSWDLHDDYEEVRRSLFKALVANELLDIGCSEAVRPPPLVLRVVPRRSVILINRSSQPGGYWDAAKDLVVSEGEIELEFIDYFDFSAFPVKELEYFRCRVLRFPARVEYEGRDALLKPLDCHVMFDEESNNVPQS